MQNLTDKSERTRSTPGISKSPIVSSSVSFPHTDSSKVKDKLKVNMGFLAFKKAKLIQPMKFQYREAEKQEIQSTVEGNIKYSKFFKQNPELIEFMKITTKGEEDEEKEAVPVAKKVEKSDSKKKKQKSLLVSDKRLKGSKAYLLSN